MGDLLKLRPFQREAVAAVERDWADGVRRPALVMATGSGKTRTAAHIIDRHKGPVLFLVHRDELAGQSRQEFTDQGLDVGTVKAELDEVDRRVVVGSVQTLQNPVRLSRLIHGQPPGPLLIVVDECHMAAAPSYMGILTALGAFDDEGSTAALGLTATLSRSDGQGLGRIWQKVSFRYDILDGIADGYLVDVEGRMVTIDGMSLTEARMSGGDFTLGSLSDILISNDAMSATVAAYNQYAADMKGIVFTPTVQASHAFAAAFRDAGYETETVWGDMPIAQRRDVMERARAGKIQILVNCMVLTVGTDLPPFQCAVIARPTTDPGLYTQIAGRVLRTHPGKGKALILDLVGVSQDHRLATLVDLSTRRITSVRPGESLAEAAQREIRARNPKLAGYVIDSEEVDLFRQSEQVWLQTRAGVWFTRTGNAVVVLWPSKLKGRYHVAIRPLQGPGGRWIRKNLPLDLAMSWGEESAQEYAEAWQKANGHGFGTHRKASWRSRPAGQDTIRLAESLGIEVPEGIRQGALSCIIDVERASRIIDHKLVG